MPDNRKVTASREENAAYMNQVLPVKDSFDTVSYTHLMMKKYAQEAGIPSYSAQSIRNSCGCTLFAYEASPEQVARQMGTTGIQIKRYQNISYKEALQREAGRLVKLKIEPP